MKKRLVSALALVLCLGMTVTGLSGCGKSEDVAVKDNGKTKGETLSIMVSAGWMDNRYDDMIKKFEDKYDCKVDLQTIPADQYSDLLQSKLTTNSAADVFWIQSNPFAIESTIVDPEKYCIDFTGADWESLMPESRLSSCKYDDKLYGLQIWHGSPEYVVMYNKSLFDENGWKQPANYAEFKTLCEQIKGKDITPLFLPGADIWQHPTMFFQIGGAYCAQDPDLYDKLNTNKATFAENDTMKLALDQFKELSDDGAYGKDWIGTDSTNIVNEVTDRTSAMCIANTSFLKQIREETDCKDDFGFFPIPLADNDYYPVNPSGPTMFGSKSTKHEGLVKDWFNFVAQTDSLQSILDNSPSFTNLDVTDKDLRQNWQPEEEEFVENTPDEKKQYTVLQTGTKYTNDYWNDFGEDMIAMCQGKLSSKQVLQNMDDNRAEAAELAEDPNWK